MDMSSMGGASGGGNNQQMMQAAQKMFGGGSKNKSMQELINQAMGISQPEQISSAARLEKSNSFAEALKKAFTPQKNPEQLTLEPAKNEALKNAFAQKKELNNVILPPEDDETKFLS